MHIPDTSPKILSNWVLGGAWEYVFSVSMWLYLDRGSEHRPEKYAQHEVRLFVMSYSVWLIKIKEAG